MYYITGCYHIGINQKEKFDWEINNKWYKWSSTNLIKHIRIFNLFENNILHKKIIDFLLISLYRFISFFVYYIVYILV